MTHRIFVSGVEFETDGRGPSHVQATRRLVETPPTACDGRVVFEGATLWCGFTLSPPTLSIPPT